MVHRDFFQFWISLGKARSDRLSVELKDNRVGSNWVGVLWSELRRGVAEADLRAWNFGGGRRHSSGRAGEWVKAGGGDLGY